VLIICSVNPSWTEFNPSPFSRRYFSAGELHALLERHGLRASLFGGFSERRSGLGTLIAALRRIAVRFHLIPKTMKGKQLLKRIFMGRLHPLPAEVSEEHGAYVQPQPIESCDLSSTKVLYAVGTR
jgi:hypothetical protein